MPVSLATRIKIMSFSTQQKKCTSCYFHSHPAAWVVGIAALPNEVGSKVVPESFPAQKVYGTGSKQHCKQQLFVVATSGRIRAASPMQYRQRMPRQLLLPQPGLIPAPHHRPDSSATYPHILAEVPKVLVELIADIDADRLWRLEAKYSLPDVPL